MERRRDGNRDVQHLLLGEHAVRWALLVAVVWRTLGISYRQLVTLLSLAVGVMLLSLFLAISYGYWARFSDVPEQNLIARSAHFGFLPVALAARIGAREDIGDIAYRVTFPVSRGDVAFLVEAVGGLSESAFNPMGLEVGPGPEAMLGGNRIGALIGEDLAADLDVHVGDAVVVQSRGIPRRDGTSQWAFEVVGVYSPIGILSADRFFANYDYIDASVTKPGVVSTLFLTVRSGVAVGEVAAAIEDESLNSAFPLSVLPMESWLSLDGRPIGDTLTMISVVGALVAGIALLVQGSATAQHVSAKGPLLAVLRLYGHSWPAIWCCVAAVVGLFSLGAAAAGCCWHPRCSRCSAQPLRRNSTFPRRCCRRSLRAWRCSRSSSRPRPSRLGSRRRWRNSLLSSGASKSRTVRCRAGRDWDCGSARRWSPARGPP